MERILTYKKRLKLTIKYCEMILNMMKALL